MVPPSDETRIQSTAQPTAPLEVPDGATCAEDSPVAGDAELGFVVPATLEIPPADHTASTLDGAALLTPTPGDARRSTAFSWDAGAGRGPGVSPLKGAPSVVGYEILGELGRGGMGVVYHARHRGLKREVALKMVLAGGHASEEQLTRFRAEAEAVANLQHPNIVQIHDVGEQDGLPFFSLEYVAGPTLDKALAGKPWGEKVAARMVEKLARAIHYAHERGIVHRDLKPTNVLLTELGEPKITDFGLVKRLDDGDSGSTRTGTILGTPGYMAPEQGSASKDVGPLADVYALGSTLYALLTGRPPFSAATPFKTLMHLLKDEPVPPSRLQGGISRDIETICLKCLQKDPHRRYASALDLAEDLRRFLQNEPILGRPVGRVERSWRWCRRRPLVAGLLILVAMLGLTVLIGAPIAAVMIANERDGAISARDTAKTMQVVAEQSARAATAAQAQAEIAQGQAEASALRALEEKARADQNAQRAEKQRELAIGALDTLVNQVQNRLGDTARTFRLKRELLETAFEGLNQVAASGEHGSDDADATRADAHLRMGQIFLQLGHADSARMEYSTACEILRKLAAAEPENPQLQYNLSRAAMRLAGASLLLGNLTAAETEAREALKLRSELFTQRQRADMARNLAKSLVLVGDVVRDLGRVDDANAEFERALDIQRQLLNSVTNNGAVNDSATDQSRAGYQDDLRTTLERLGELHLVWRDEPAKARDFYLEALPLAQAAAGASDNQQTRARQNLALTLSRLGTVSRRLKDSAAAAGYLEESLKLWKALAAEEDPELLLAQGELALALGREGDHQAAAVQAERLQELSPEFARNVYNVACCYALCAGAVANQSAANQSAAGPLAAEQESLRSKYVGLAVQAIRRAGELGLQNLAYLGLDPDLDAIRHEPSFQEALTVLSALPKSETGP